MSLDSPVREYRTLYAGVPAGVAAVCAELGGAPDGMAASSLVPVSLDPPLLSFCVQKTSRTWPRLRYAPHLGVSVLAHDQEPACAALSAREGDRFAGLAWHSHPAGGVFIQGASAHFDCTVERELDAGDHLIVLLRVHDGRRADVSPLIFHDSSYRTIART
ncbi:flavin reductase family protein [Amycolatopsis jejuensis]|uniref:flavin reductase family protein n=1 Tax=Amycolatopsis jejuensis TaxID=330084 RepID=UPI000524D299|nr:flavin reductase family protein [Amycolatopsis jejuensis]